MTTATLRTSEAPTSALASSSSFTAFMLEQIRCAKLRAEITANQCEMAAAALSAGIVSPEMALLVLYETDIEVSS